MLSAVIALAVSTIALLFIRKPESLSRTVNGQPAGAFWRELRAGVRTVVDNHILRGLTACGATMSFGINMMLAVWLVFAYRRLHITPAEVGLVLSAGALGFVPSALALRWPAGSASDEPLSSLHLSADSACCWFRGRRWARRFSFSLAPGCLSTRHRRYSRSTR